MTKCEWPDVVEVRECHQKDANELLTNGRKDGYRWILLTIAPKEYKQHSVETYSTHVFYIMGKIVDQVTKDGVL